MRCFVAVECPGEVKEKLLCVEREISGLGDMTLVRPENMHLTMKFLGEIPEDRVGSVSSALSAIDYKAYTITVKGIGVFPKPDYVRVIWVGVEDFGMTTNLASRIDEAVLPLGFPKDDKFHPHITIARVKFVKDRNALKNLLQSKTGEAYGEYKAERMVLMKSILSPKGPEYSVIKEFKFK